VYHKHKQGAHLQVNNALNVLSGKAKKRAVQSWYPDAPDQEGVWCDAEVIAGSDSSMAADDILRAFCEGEIRGWLETLASDPACDAPTTIAAKITGEGRTFTATAKIEHDADIAIEEGE